MLTDRQDKIAIVTGGTSGIGRDTAILLSKADAKPVVVGRREKERKEVVDLSTVAGHPALFVKTDVSQSGEVQSLVQGTGRTMSRLDLTFNNAGIEGNGISIVD